MRAAVMRDAVREVESRRAARARAQLETLLRTLPLGECAYIYDGSEAIGSAWHEGRAVAAYLDRMPGRVSDVSLARWVRL